MSNFLWSSSKQPVWLSTMTSMPINCFVTTIWCNRNGHRWTLSAINMYLDHPQVTMNEWHIWRDINWMWLVQNSYVLWHRIPRIPAINLCVYLSLFPSLNNPIHFFLDQHDCFSCATKYLRNLSTYNEFQRILRTISEKVKNYIIV